MTFNEFQKNYWQKDAAVSKLTIDTDMLIKEVKRNKTSFESTIFWRDFREVTAAVVVAGVLVYKTVRSDGNIWEAASFTVTAISVLFIGVFFVIDRFFQRKKHATHTEPLLTCIESSLSQIKHQIWLLKNVFWWYILPPGIGVAMVFIVRYWQKFQVLPAAQVFPQCLYDVAFAAIVFWGVLLLNKWYIRTKLVPRQDELETMQKNILNDKSV
jgi:hypothetical protein